MAVNKEEMKYVFSGDVSSLSESTTEAISLLEQYGNEIKKIVKQTKEMVQATTQAKTSSATFKVLKDSATTAANAMKKFAGSKMNFEGMKKDVATLAATVIMKVATIKYQFDSLAPKMQSLKSKFAATFPKLSKFVGSAASAFRRVAKGVAEDTSAIIKNTNITKNLNKAKQKKFGLMMEDYLTSRKNLKQVFMLIDFRHKPTSDDIMMYNYLKHYNIIS